jgi:type I restriction enzyme S subunit
MGRIAIVPENAKKGIINQALLKLTPNLSVIAPAFLKSILENNEIQNEYFRDTSGAAIKMLLLLKF